MLWMANTQHWLTELLWNRYWAEEGSMLLLDRLNTHLFFVWSNLCKCMTHRSDKPLIILYFQFGPLPIITRYPRYTWRRCMHALLYSLWTSRRAVLEMMPASFLAETVYHPASSFRAGWMIIQRYPKLSWCMLGNRTQDALEQAYKTDNGFILHNHIALIWIHMNKPRSQTKLLHILQLVTNCCRLSEVA